MVGPAWRACSSMAKRAAVARPGRAGAEARGQNLQFNAAFICVII